MNRATIVYKIRLYLAYILMVCMVAISLLPALASISHLIDTQGKVVVYFFTGSLIAGVAVLALAVLSDPTGE